MCSARQCSARQCPAPCRRCGCRSWGSGCGGGYRAGSAARPSEACASHPLERSAGTSPPAHLDGLLAPSGGGAHAVPCGPRSPAAACARTACLARPPALGMGGAAAAQCPRDSGRRPHSRARCPPCARPGCRLLAPPITPQITRQNPRPPTHRPHPRHLSMRRGLSDPVPLATRAALGLISTAALLLARCASGGFSRRVHTPVGHMRGDGRYFPDP